MIAVANSALRILSTSLPPRSKYDMPLFDDARVLKEFRAALDRGVKIDIILRETGTFQSSHPLYCLSSHKNFKVYDAESKMVKLCKCRYVIADDKHLKFRFEPEKGE